MAEWVEFVGLVDRAAQRKIDHADVVFRFQSDRLVDGGDHHAVGAGAILVQNSQVDDVRARSDALESLVENGPVETDAIPRDQAGDMSAVAILITGAGVSRDEDC